MVCFATEESVTVSLGILLNLELVCNFLSKYKLQTDSLLLVLHFIRTRFQWYHTHSNSRAISLASKEVLYKGLSLCLSSHQCLLMMHAAHIFNTNTLHSLSFTHILKSWMSDSIFFFFISYCFAPLLAFVVFVWLLSFVCLLFPDGRHRLHLCGFQVPRELFTALAQALILFPLASLYDGPF